MARSLDVVFGVFLGIVGTGAVNALTDAPSLDPVKLSPQYYKVRLDNARVRVLEFHLKPGEKEVMHSHPEGVVFVLADAMVKNTFPDGSATTRRVAQGDIEWSDPITHTGENVGASEAHYYRVELKNGPK